MLLRLILYVGDDSNGDSGCMSVAMERLTRVEKMTREETAAAVTAVVAIESQVTRVETVAAATAVVAAACVGVGVELSCTRVVLCHRSGVGGGCLRRYR